MNTGLFVHPEPLGKLPYLVPSLVSRLQDCRHLGATWACHRVRISVEAIKKRPPLVFMATAEDVGVQPDWHGQDCFMGIGRLQS